MSDPINLLTGDDCVAGVGVRHYATYPCPMRPGKSLRCRSLFESEQSQFDNSMLNKRTGGFSDRLRDGQREYIALVAVDADGKQMLTREKVAAMAEQDSGFVSWLYKTCCEHTQAGEADLEALVKNSEATDVVATRSVLRGTPVASTLSDGSDA